MVQREDVIAVLQQIEDPEIFLDIWFLGLVYSIEFEGEHKIKIQMTFTSPMCPYGPTLLEEVKTKVEALEGVEEVEVEVVFDPPWVPSDEVKGLLGMM